MIKSIIYKLLNLEFPSDEKSKNEYVYLGSFKPIYVDEVVANVNSERVKLLTNIIDNYKNLGISGKECDDLSRMVRRTVTYKDFLKKIKENQDRRIYSDYNKVFGDLREVQQMELKDKAIQYSKKKVREKKEKFELTLKEEDRLEEKYYNEYISNYRRYENEFKRKYEEEERAKATKFLNEYSEDLKGYKKYLRNNTHNKSIVEILEKDFDFYLPNSDFKKHCFITGRTGSGKSELIKLFVYSDILKRQNGLKISTVTIEPHGDLSNEIVHFKENYKNNDLVYIAPNLKDNFTTVINPFQIDESNKTETNIDILSGEILNVFKLVFDSSFSLPMESLLSPCITAIIYLNNPSLKRFAGIEELQRFMDDNNNSDLIEFAIKNLPNPNHKRFFQSAFKNSNLSTTKQALYSKIQTFLNSSIFSRMIQGKSTINLERELNSGKLIVINLSKGLMGENTSKFMGALLISQINYLVLKRANQPKEQRTPINLIIDESHNYLTNKIGTALGELRKYGLNLTLATQIVGQNSSAELEKMILSNTLVKIVGMNGVDSLNKLSKEILIPLDYLFSLKVGEFFIKVGDKEAIKFKGSNLLLNSKNSLEFLEFKELIEEQIKKYYRRLDTIEPIPKTETTEKKEVETAPKTKYNLPPRGV
jgi:energy-coupling factor transporter ATP-binding protein EcfA2